jgi:hypothetical protein
VLIIQQSINLKCAWPVYRCNWFFALCVLCRPDQVAAAGQTNARRFKWQHNFKTTLDDLRLIGAQHFQRQEQRLQSGLQQDPGWSRGLLDFRLKQTFPNIPN